MDQMTTEEIEAELNRLGCAEQFGSRTDELEAELRVRFGVVERAEHTKRVRKRKKKYGGLAAFAYDSMNGRQENRGGKLR